MTLGSQQDRVLESAGVMFVRPYKAELEFEASALAQNHPTSMMEICKLYPPIIMAYL
jgi:hypothetical protein